TKGVQAWVLVFLSFVWIVLSWINFQSCWFRLTKDRLFVKPGFPWPKIHDFPLDTIKSVTVYQPVLGKFLDFGKIRIIRTDGNKKLFKMIGSPHLLTSAIYDAKAALAPELPPETIDSDEIAPPSPSP
ncbi:MAG TPA: PH domain-containing protein, partial [Syntrophorhabdaceae bacterium]